MRISQVESMVLAIPTRREIADSHNVLRQFELVMALVHSDEGITGTGYTLTVGSGGGVIREAIEAHLKKALIGQDPFDVRKIWNEMYWGETHWIGRAGVTTMAMAALDIAVWDLMAKACEKPLWKLLGGCREEIPAYNTDGGWLSWSEGELVADMSRMIDQGFQGVKMKVGQKDPWADLKRVEAVRKALGSHVRLMVDVNQKWDLHTAMAFGKKLEDYDIFWLEEPLHPDDIKGHAKLAQELNPPIALGEHVYTKYAFRDYMEQSAVEIVQVDVTRVGGVTEFMTVAALADSHNLPISPHAGDLMQVHQHLVCAAPNALFLEYIPWGLELFVEPVVVKEGYLEAPQAPGASTEIKEEMIRKYRVT
ncbi:MAG: mandelate racemase/muconate lactonizing enzyme family protein [bacterium]